MSEYSKMRDMQLQPEDLNFDHHNLNSHRSRLVLFYNPYIAYDAYSQRPDLIFLLILILICNGGCASPPKPLSPEHRMYLGRVGVVALSSTPRVEFQTFAKGWAAGAAKGGSLGSGKYLVFLMT